MENKLELEEPKKNKHFDVKPPKPTTALEKLGLKIGDYVRVVRNRFNLIGGKWCINTNVDAEDGTGLVAVPELAVEIVDWRLANHYEDSVGCSAVLVGMVVDPAGASEVCKVKVIKEGLGVRASDDNGDDVGIGRTLYLSDTEQRLSPVK